MITRPDDTVSPTKGPDVVLTVAETAAFLKISESVVRRLIRERRIPYFKIEGRYLIYRPAIEQWIHSIILPPLVAADPRAKEITERLFGERS